MSIHSIVLFVSSNSQHCAQPVGFVRQSNLPIPIVKLDTIRDRRAAANGKHFQIHAVPTLVVTYQDGTLQMFASQEKILSWLKKLVQPPQPTPPPEPTQTQYTSVVSSSDDDYEPIEQVPKKKKKSLNFEFSDKKTKKMKPSKKKTKSSSKSSKVSSKGLYSGKKKVQKPPPVNFEEESEGEDMIFFEDEDEEYQPQQQQRRPPPPPTEGLMVGARAPKKQGSRMNDVQNIAKEMEKQRQQTLGYNENDLPYN